MLECMMANLKTRTRVIICILCEIILLNFSCNDKTRTGKAEEGREGGEVGEG